MKKRTILLILSPFILIILLFSIIIGVISLNLEAELIVDRFDMSLETARLAVLVFSFISIPFKIIFIALMFAIAFWIHRRNWRIAGGLFRSRLVRDSIVEPSAVVYSLADHEHHPPEVMSAQHEDTVQQLIASIVSLTAFSAATILSLAQFVTLANLAVLVTVITGGLAWGARTLISDLLSGISNIFEDNFDVGDKIEFLYAGKHLEGVIEKVTVRLAQMRAPTGELIIVPHGELRILRNFTRGRFSGTTVTLLINSKDLPRAIELLRELAPKTPEILPDLLEPWLVLSREGELGPQTEITLINKAVHGHGAELRLKIMDLATTHLQEAGIMLGGET